MNPLDELPLVLDTPEAQDDKARFLLAIVNAKGKYRLNMIRSFIDRYHEVPNL